MFLLRFDYVVKQAKDFKKELELATKNATVLVSNPDTIKSMEEKERR